MNENERAENYLKKLFESSPWNFIERVDNKRRGIFVLLKALSKSEKEVCAGDISKAFKVSTARVAIILKKLVKRGLIETTTSKEDKRKVIVKITELGKSEVEKGENEMINIMKTLIREVGEEEMNEFLRISTKINGVLNNIEIKCADE